MNKAAHMFSVWIAENRMKKGTVADMIGVKTWTLSRLLSGVTKPDINVAVEIENLTKGKVRVQDWTIPFAHKKAEAAA